MIKQLSWKIAIAMGSQLQSSDSDIEVYAYGLESFLNNFLEVVLLVVLSVVLNMFVPTMLVLAAFALVRVPGGGAHLGTYPRCLVASLLSILLLARLSIIYTMTGTVFLIFLISLAAVGIAAILLWVPAGTEKKRVTDNREIIQQKYVTGVLLILCLMVAWMWDRNNSATYATAVILGNLWGVIMISPIGYWFFGVLDHWMDLVQRR